MTSFIKWTGPISFECGEKNVDVYIKDNKIIFNDSKQQIVLYEGSLIPDNAKITDYEMITITLSPNEDFDFNLYLGGKQFSNIIVAVQEYKYVIPNYDVYGSGVNPQYDEYKDKLVLTLNIDTQSQTSPLFVDMNIYNLFIWMSPSQSYDSQTYNIIKPMMISNKSSDIEMKIFILLFNIEQEV